MQKNTGKPPPIFIPARKHYEIDRSGIPHQLASTACRFIAKGFFILAPRLVCFWGVVTHKPEPIVSNVGGVTID
ncbi:hypothetical protein PhaeoP18_03979 (plasmid) [Phaeobacter piscinae]|nr:hypothetical protein [Phaeobacter piscinae]ATG41772.1 hypothetical protein PhaeoP14_03740 [Phaeobacter piscinae]AUR38195.1 hypothetical protein PhaeoP18_03979 [Phaeobacter piscinae]